jgi:predicted ArsR family transcriptional regulator
VPSEIAEDAPAERVAAAVEMFREHGVVADYEAEGDTYLLHERTCPYPEVARRNGVSCVMEVSLLRLVTGLEARLTECVLRGDECCTYRLGPEFAAAR